MTRFAWLLTALLAAWASQPPGVVARTSALEQVSGERALDVLDELLEGIGPHPIGSPANRVVEERLRTVLNRLGTVPIVEEHGFCEGQTCMVVRNVVAMLPGIDPEAPWILVNAHYDSVWSGPGWGDDGSGVAASLETLRALKQGPPLPVNVLFLFNEGEEDGLLGSKAFLAQSRFKDRIGAVANLEARGTSGQAYLFEIKGSTASIGAAYAQHARRPAVSSLYTTIYDLLPNNTDATVFAASGLPVANVAFLGSGHQYHTPLDDRHHLDVRSLQHQCDQSLALVKGLSQAEPASLSNGGDAVIFDVLGLLVVRYPQGFGMGLLLALTGIVVWRARPTLPAMATVLLLPVLLSLGLLFLDLVVHAAGADWDAWPGLTGFLVATVVVSATLLVPRGERQPMNAALLVFFALGLAATTFFLPGGSWLFGISSLMALPLLLLPGSWTAASVMLAAYPWLLLGFGLPDALGSFSFAVAVPMAIASLPLLTTPVVPGLKRVLLTAVVLLASTPLWPDETAEHPRLERGHAISDGSSGWSTRRFARFARSVDPRVRPPDATLPPPLPFYRVVPDVPFRPEGTLHDLGGGNFRLKAEGGWAVRIHSAGGLTSVGGLPVSGTGILWLGDTSDLTFTATGRPENVVTAVARPAPPSAVLPIHDGLRRWSLLFPQ